MRTLIFICALTLFLALPAAAQDDPDLAALLETYASATLAPDDPAAIAVQVSGAGELMRAAIGTADGLRAASPDDGFRIASMSKTFVAATALLMQESGLLALDDPAANYLPAEVVANIANLSGADSATLRHLLAMQSGIDDYLDHEPFWDRVEADPSHAWTAAEALTYAYGLEPLFAPGETVSYSNTNYLLIQLALEQAGGAPLHALIRQYILNPLGLTSTYTQAFETPPAGVALVTGYLDYDEDGAVDDVSAINDGFGLGDGGLVSTLADMTAFYNALLLEETLLSAESLAQMQQFVSTEDDDYGLGLFRIESEYGPAIGHSGGVLGFLSVALALPEEELIVVVLCATESCDPETLAASALDLWLNS